jgi:hypothetical protein
MGRRIARARAWQALPARVRQSVEGGACQALFEIRDDLDSVPLGRLAAAALRGFAGDLPRGWRLVGPEGEEVRLRDLSKAMEWMGTGLLEGVAEDDDLEG